MAMTRGSYIALLQDDDLYLDESWWRVALALMEDDPSIGVCGGLAGLDLMEPDNVALENDPLLHHTRFPDRLSAGVYSWPGVAKYRLYLASDIRTTRYVDTVNRAPMLIRRSILADIGFLDEAFAPFQCDDKDFCIRVWKGGWKVVLYDSKVLAHSYQGGMRRLDRSRVIVQSYRNHLRLNAKHADFLSRGGHVSYLDEAERRAK